MALAQERSQCTASFSAGRGTALLALPRVRCRPASQRSAGLQWQRKRQRKRRREEKMVPRTCGTDHVDMTSCHGTRGSRHASAAGAGVTQGRGLAPAGWTCGCSAGASTDRGSALLQGSDGEAGKAATSACQRLHCLHCVFHRLNEIGGTLAHHASWPPSLPGVVLPRSAVLQLGGLRGRAVTVA